MKRHRLTNEQKNYVARQLSQGLSALNLTPAEIAAVMTAGSVPLPVDIGRRIARMDEYQERGICIWQVQRALGEWIMYKAGVRSDAGYNEINKEETK